VALVDFSLGDIGSVFKDVREAITGKAIVDPNKKAELDTKLRQLEQELLKAQIDVNKTEAKSTSVFVAGWRPSIGWIGSLALGYTFLLAPFLSWVSVNIGWSPPPTIDTGPLFNLVTAMLGFGAFRTYEKVKGVQNKH